MRWPTVFLSLFTIAAAIYLLWDRWSTVPEHPHVAGDHGGIVVAVGDEYFHIEALLAQGGMLKLFTLGPDQSEVITVPAQKITAYARPPDRTDSVEVAFEPKPQQGDPTGKTSSFEAQLPPELVGSELQVVVPSMAIGNSRYRFSFAIENSHVPQMPIKVTDDAEQQLYLTPGGKYTVADIKANGSQTASQKFQGFVSAHDMHPEKGVAICPITETKSNPACTWIIGGKTYSFCCPPCIDEFVKLAKEQPGKVLEPDSYIKK